MKILTTLPIVALALLALAPSVPAQDAAADDVDREFNVYVHEPFHVLPERMTVQEGETVRLRIINGNPNPHDLMVCGDGVKEGHECTDVWGYTAVAANSEAVLVFTASKAGTFEYYCSMLGHKQGGMKGELEVQGSAVTRNESPGPAVPLVVGAVALLAALVGRRALP